MSSELGRRVRGLLWMLAAIGMGGAFAVAMTSCAREEERLPGRSRPLLAHDWPHPRDYKFAPTTFKAPEPTLVAARSGLRAYVIPSEADPVVRVTAAIPSGRLYEQAGEAGAAALLTQILARRGPANPARPLSLRLADLGTELQVEESPTLTRISVEVLSEDWRDALALMIDLLRRPDLDEGFIRGYRAGAGYSEPTSGVAGSGFRPKVELERLLGGYPLAPPDPGSSLTPAAVRAVASRTLGANRVVLGIGGGLPRAEAESALEELSQGWAGATAELKLASNGGGAGGGSPHTIEAPYLEGWIAIGRVVGPLSQGEQAPVAVMASIFNTRLNIAIREIRGLANRAVLELPETPSGAGLLHIRTGGRLESVGPLVKFSLDELDRMQSASDTISAEELERAKGALVLGAWQGALDGARQASATYAVETVNRGGVEELLKWPEAVQAVTAEQVKAVAQKYLKPIEMKTVIVGPIEKIRPARHPRWPVGLDELASKTS
jgi:zinc protease